MIMRIQQIGRSKTIVHTEKVKGRPHPTVLAKQRAKDKVIKQSRKINRGKT